MSGCSGNGDHSVTFPLPADLGELLAEHAAEDGPPALVPCVDYSVSWRGAPAGALVSLPDDGRPPFDAFDLGGAWLGEGDTIAAALALIAAQLGTCRYSAAHLAARVPAVVALDCGRVGVVPACRACAEFYARMGSG
jgi:hypothetical protein